MNWPEFWTGWICLALGIVCGLVMAASYVQIKLNSPSKLYPFCIRRHGVHAFFRSPKDINIFGTQETDIILVEKFTLKAAKERNEKRESNDSTGSPRQEQKNQKADYGCGSNNTKTPGGVAGPSCPPNQGDFKKETP